MATMKIKKGDLVKVLSGKDKGKTGKVIEVMPKIMKVVVEGLNIHHRFEKKSGGKAGTQVAFPGSMAISKVMAIDPKSGKPSRIGYTFLENGAKQKVYKASQSKTEKKA
jgi:large subunit ribosomal protein L24